MARFKTSGAADNALAQLLQLAQMSQNRKISQQKVEVQREKNRQDKEKDVSNSYGDFVDNAVTPEDIVAARQTSNHLDGLIKNNPDAFINKRASDAKLNEKASDYMNYKATIDSAYDKYQYAKNLTNEQIQGWTLKDIMNELDYVENFESLMYEDPIDKKDPVKFAGHYTSKGLPAEGKEPNPLMRDTAIINEMIGDKGYKAVLNTALMALRTGNVIDDEELFYVLTGNKEGLKNKVTEIKEVTGGNIKSYRSSMNSIKKYRKQLDVAVAKKGIKGDQEFGLANIPMDAILAEYNIDKDSEWFQDESGEPLSFDDYKEEKMAEYADMTIQQVLDMWTKEEESLKYLMEEELYKYYKWVGEEYIEKGAVERAFKRELEKTKNK